MAELDMTLTPRDYRLYMSFGGKVCLTIFNSSQASSLQARANVQRCIGAFTRTLIAIGTYIGDVLSPTPRDSQLCLLTPTYKLTPR